MAQQTILNLARRDPSRSSPTASASPFAPVTTAAYRSSVAPQHARRFIPNTSNRGHFLPFRVGIGKATGVAIHDLGATTNCTCTLHRGPAAVPSPAHRLASLFRVMSPPPAGTRPAEIGCSPLQPERK